MPNRRGQPLVHRWYAARFESGHPTGVEDFGDLLATTRLGREPLPNAGEEVDRSSLERLLPPAVEAVKRRVLADRDRFRADTRPRLNDQLERLERLQGRQLAFIDERFDDRRDTRSGHRREQKERWVRNLFRNYQQWIEDAMTTADDPFLQVVAVLVGC